MTDTYDVAVVGGGPAGISAAVTAAENGLRVVVIDAAPQLGGQYWRHPDETTSRDDEAAGHHAWGTFARLRDRFRGCQERGVLSHRPGLQIWFIERPGESHVLRVVPTVEDPTAPEGRPSKISARSLVLCPGGYDRQLPIDGWDLPGVMAAGGVQALLKGDRSLAGKRAVVAGTGPFLLPVAKGLADAGATVVAVCEANRLTGWVRQLPGAIGVPAKGIEAVSYAKSLIKHRIPYRQRTAVTAIGGTDQVDSVTCSRLDGAGRIRSEAGVLEVDLVALGWGFTPSLELITATGADTRKDVDDSLVACVDDLQRSTVPGVYVAGEATGVGGAALATAEGELAGLAVVRDQGGSIPARRQVVLQQIIRRHRAFARSMHLAHPVPPAWHEWLRPETTVCRCEEVSFGEICRVRDELGAEDARTIKGLARPGMGWCQGRVCGYATAKLAAAPSGRDLTVDDLRPLAKQSLTAPVSLSELARD